jgi:hypothetical protein
MSYDVLCNKLGIDIVINNIYNPRMELRVLHKTFMKKMQIFIRGRGREIIILFIYFYPQEVIFLKLMPLAKCDSNLWRGDR